MRIFSIVTLLAVGASSQAGEAKPDAVNLIRDVRQSQAAQSYAWVMEKVRVEVIDHQNDRTDESHMIMSKPEKPQRKPTRRFRTRP